MLFIFKHITKIKAFYCLFFHTMYHLGDSIKYILGWKIEKKNSNQKLFQRPSKIKNGMQHSMYFEVGNLDLDIRLYNKHKRPQLNCVNHSNFHTQTHTVSHRFIGGPLQFLFLFYMSIPIFFLFSIIFDILNHYTNYYKLNHFLFIKLSNTLLKSEFYM